MLKAQAYRYGDDLILYPKPKHFGFVTAIPRTFAGAAKMSFNKKSIKAFLKDIIILPLAKRAAKILKISKVIFSIYNAAKDIIIK